jgi:alkylation response protein AidB-like acyl-CoA dehydrogenase
VGAPRTLGARAIAPLLVSFGTTSQRDRLLFDALAGRVVWCELFSEPGAGSDLASLSTRAFRDGSKWVVNGQKVWSSGAAAARWGLLAARTDPSVPKQRGLTCFAIDMRQPGVEVRPLRTMAGDSRFSEVFLTDARVTGEDVIGDVGRGWDVTKAALAHERNVIRGMAENTAFPLDAPAGAFNDGEGRGALATGAGAFPLVRTLLDAFGGCDDAVVRQQVASLYSLVEIAAWSRRRRVDASTLKLLTGRVTVALRDLAVRLEGARGMLADADAPLGAVVQRLLLTSPSMSIMVGTDEIQRNVIGERVLGLPAEPSVDRDMPWSAVARS